MAEIRWSLTAERDLREIEDFIARDAPLRAVAFINRLVEAVENLDRAPLLGRTPEFQREDLRELIFRAYRVVYRLEGAGQLTILRVVHGARELRGPAGREPWDFG